MTDSNECCSALNQANRRRYTTHWRLPQGLEQRLDQRFDKLDRWRNGRHEDEDKGGHLVKVLRIDHFSHLEDLRPFWGYE